MSHPGHTEIILRSHYTQTQFTLGHTLTHIHRLYPNILHNHHAHMCCTFIMLILPLFLIISTYYPNSCLVTFHCLLTLYFTSNLMPNCCTLRPSSLPDYMYFTPFSCLITYYLHPTSCLIACYCHTTFCLITYTLHPNSYLITYTLHPTSCLITCTLIIIQT
jgi:hypothetical protein